MLPSEELITVNQKGIGRLGKCIATIAPVSCPAHETLPLGLGQVGDNGWGFISFLISV